MKHYDHVVVIERPKLTIGPTDPTGIKKHDSVDFICHFNASLMQYLAHCAWLKDEDPTIIGNKWQIAQPGFKNHLICGLNITNVLTNDEGSYTCYCYYNKSFWKEFHIPNNEEIKSQYGRAELKFQTSKAANIYNQYAAILCVYTYIT